MNADRLLKMAAFLEALPPHKFDFQTYVTLGSKQPLEALAAPEENCGTTACAVGWMPAIFPEEFEWSGILITSGGGDMLPVLKGSREWDEPGIRQFLDIDESQYMYLFIPGESDLDSDATATEVAAQIREFVAVGGVSAYDSDDDSDGDSDDY